MKQLGTTCNLNYKLKIQLFTRTQQVMQLRRQAICKKNQCLEAVSMAFGLSLKIQGVVKTDTSRTCVLLKEPRASAWLHRAS